MRARQRNGWISFLGVGLMLAGLIIGGSGCARRYRVTLTNGHVFTAAGKPKFDKKTGVYSFKDTQGKPVTVPGFRVQEVAPLGMEQKVDFSPPKAQSRPYSPTR